MYTFCSQNRAVRVFEFFTKHIDERGWGPKTHHMCLIFHASSQFTTLITSQCIQQSIFAINNMIWIVRWYLNLICRSNFLKVAINTHFRNIQIAFQKNPSYTVDCWASNASFKMLSVYFSSRNKRTIFIWNLQILPPLNRTDDKWDLPFAVLVFRTSYIFRCFEIVIAT